MAHMIPPMSPENGPGMQAETLLFEALRDSLPDDFFVYHSVKYVNPKNAYEGEVDFLILHPEYGILVIECKGKGVFFNNSSSKWVRYENSCQRVISSPFTQVKGQKYDLIEIFKGRMKKDFPDTDKHFPLPFGSAVATPLALFRDSDLPPGILREMIIDSSDLGRLHDKIMESMLLWKKRHGDYKQFNNSTLNRFRHSVLHPGINLAPSLGGRLELGRQRFLQLSKTQSQFIHSLRLNNRICIQGGAGTGKTVLALEAARELSAKGQKVLLICFTSALGKHLKHRVEEMECSTVHACTFHSLIAQLCTKMGISIDKQIQKSSSESEFWNEDAPLFISEAAERGVLEKYDAILLDEGQDFHENWWDFLSMFLNNSETSKFYIFYDPMQNIYHQKFSVPDFAVKFSLDINFRNTKLIAREIEKIAHTGAKPAEDSPMGIKPVFHEQRSPAKTVESVTKLISTLIFKENIGPDQITILTPHSHKNSSLKKLHVIGGIPLSFLPLERHGQILHSTIGKFKGLESDVVILVDIDPEDPLANKKACYVALSRARQILHVFHKGSWSFYL
jgi:Nuclease-related domain/AAA domain